MTMQHRHIMVIVGARPNLVKVAPLLRVFDNIPRFRVTLVHTGQHYDPNLSDQFFIDLGIRSPNVHLAVGSDTQARQTGSIMAGLEEIMRKDKADIVIVVGDVNSTLAAALVAKKEGIIVAHVEAGLRSFDWSMPEEVNRRVTDTLSDLFFVTEPSARSNLLQEGHPQHAIHDVGNVMVDSLLFHRSAFEHRSGLRNSFGVEEAPYAYATVHRPGNVDTRESLEKVISIFEDTAAHLPLLFSCHPRTKAKLQQFNLSARILGIRGLRVFDPIGYFDSLHLQMHASVVLTDSGGIQEETTALGTPCLTLRENTERPITVEEGTNTLVGLNRDNVRKELQRILSGEEKRGRRPTLWDGKAAERIAAIVERIL